MIRLVFNDPFYEFVILVGCLCRGSQVYAGGCCVLAMFRSSFTDQPVDHQAYAGIVVILQRHIGPAIAGCEFVFHVVSAIFRSQSLVGRDNTVLWRPFYDGIRTDMSQVDDIQQVATDIQKRLRKLGDNCVVALSMHKSKELIAELEEKAL